MSAGRISEHPLSPPGDVRRAAHTTRAARTTRTARTTQPTPPTQPAEPAAPTRRGLDACWFLTGYVGLLLIVPAPLKVAAFGSGGHPATLFSLGAIGWWCWHRVNRIDARPEPLHPVRVAALGLLVTVLISYAHAMAQPISLDEVSPADAGLLRVLGALGVILLATDGLRRADDIWRLMSRVVLLVAAVAALAAWQFVTGRTWVDEISIPGLGTTAGALDLGARAGLVRPAGTATHSIELGAVLAMTLPWALTVARHARRRGLYLVATALIGLGMLLALSRTALLAGVVALLVLMPGWSRAERIVGAIAGVIGLGAAFAAVPGLLGTLRGMFAFFGADPSVQSRTASYEFAWRFFSADPWVGHGFGTFLPKYWVVDNFYLQMLMETGVLGVLALVTLLGSGLWAARRARRTAGSSDRAELARACAAALAAGSVSLLFFDGFGFPQSAGMVCLAVGLCGACLRLSATEPQWRAR